MKIKAKIIVPAEEKVLLIQAIRKGNPIEMEIEFEEQSRQAVKHLWDLPEVSALQFDVSNYVVEDLDMILMALETKDVYFTHDDVQKIAMLLEKPACREDDSEPHMKKLRQILDVYFGKDMTFERFFEEVMSIIRQ